jgi:hypothetical protein
VSTLVDDRSVFTPKLEEGCHEFSGRTMLDQLLKGVIGLEMALPQVWRALQDSSPFAASRKGEVRCGGELQWPSQLTKVNWRALGDSILAVPISGRIQLAAQKCTRPQSVTAME